MNRTARFVLVLAAATALSLVAGSTAALAAPTPFGHACSAQNGVRFCPTTDLANRVPTFDGVPIDVDVTLPEHGSGPWPTIVMTHGLGGSKLNFESTTTSDHYSNVYYASRGYAVVNYSTRGFGNSCGASASRTPDCARGWVHIDDTRYEPRDVQTLLGRLADEGITDPAKIGVTGISYGGGVSNELAFLKDRIRLADGSFAPWKSPNGTPMSIRAAFPRWGWADLAAALVPNGRGMDTDVLSPTQSFSPVGVLKLSYTSGLYLAASLQGFVAPLGAEANADITSWLGRLLLGEPYADAKTAEVKREVPFHGITTIPGEPASMLIEDGWNDDLFTAQQALWVYNQARAANPNADVSMVLADTGHPRGANKSDATQAVADRGSDFFDAKLKGEGSGPPAGSVALYRQTCPKSAPTGTPITASSWSAVHPGTVKFTRSTWLPQVISSDGLNYLGELDDDPIGVTAGSAVGGAITGLLASALDPSSAIGSLPGSGALASAVHAASDACTSSLAIPWPNTANFYGSTVRRPYTLAGMPKVSLKLRTLGQNGFVAARLWDVDNQGRQILVSRGEYRLTPNQSGTITFQLHGNAYRFPEGNRPRLEVLASDGPYLRPANGFFSVAISSATVSLPTAEPNP